MSKPVLCIAIIIFIGSSHALNLDLHATSIQRRHQEITACDSRDYRNYVLKLIKEAPFAGLFSDVKNHTKFEASGVALVNESYYVVFDSSMSIAQLDENFHFRGHNNRLIGDKGPESQFEGIAYVPENDTFLLLHEALPVTPTQVGAASMPRLLVKKNKMNDDEYFKPYITTAKIKQDLSGYDIVQYCQVNFELSSSNKGFESILYVKSPQTGENYLLGLCEGNYCEGGSLGKESGNGRIVVSQLEIDEDTGDCVWQPVKMINIPPSADFVDYSAMAINYDTNKIAILSQEDAAVWLGDFDINSLDFSETEYGGEVYHLPRDNHCHIVYCNVEGLQWLDNYRILISSDKAKSKQPFHCDSKDQSIHIFAFPPKYDPYSPSSSSFKDDGEL